ALADLRLDARPTGRLAAVEANRGREFVEGGPRGLSVADLRALRRVPGGRDGVAVAEEPLASGGALGGGAARRAVLAGRSRRRLRALVFAARAADGVPSESDGSRTAGHRTGGHVPLGRRRLASRPPRPAPCRE